MPISVGDASRRTDPGPGARWYGDRMDTQREIELKLDIPPADLERLRKHPLVRDHAQGRPVTRALDTTYFDTSDHALSEAGYALRIRRVGPERIQTVKGERVAAGGVFDRLEVETSVDSDVPDLDRIPDEALAARLREIVGEKSLDPIFRTTFRRTRRILRSGETEWTLDIDEGEIVADEAREPIREVELELRTGDSAQLLEFALRLQEQLDVVPSMRSKAERGYALAQGTRAQPRSSRRIPIDPDANVEEALQSVVSQCLAHFTANAACASEGIDPEGVHQMRVGVRRARAALAIFSPVLPEASTRKLEDDLRWLGRELGAARDLDVFLGELLPKVAPHCSEDPAFKRIREEALALRTDCYGLAHDAIGSPRYARMVLEMGAWLESRAWRNQPLSEESARIFTPARTFAAARLDRRRRKVLRAATHATESDEARHALRLQLKKLRYGGEFFSDLFPERPVKRTLRRVGRLQRSLGRVNDVATAHGILDAILARLGDERSPAHDRAAGFIEGFIAHVADEAREGLARAWKRLRRQKPFWHD